jgi:hypothetical protein
LDLPLFAIEGSGVGSDGVRCSLTDVEQTHFRLECQDGPQHKSALVRLSGDRLRAEVEVDGATTQREAQVRRCSRLAPELGPLLSRPPRQPSHVCAENKNAGRVDAFLRIGRRPASGFAPIVLEVPRLGIHKSIGEAIAGYCRSAATKRGWVYLYCNDGEMGIAQRVVATPGAVIVDSFDKVLEIPTPCDSRVVLHPLPCIEVDCDGGAP